MIKQDNIKLITLNWSIDVNVHGYPENTFGDVRYERKEDSGNVEYGTYTFMARQNCSDNVLDNMIRELYRTLNHRQNRQMPYSLIKILENANLIRHFNKDNRWSYNL